jgi:hypothetical protein
VMFLVWQGFVGNLLSVVLVLFTDIFVNFCLQFRWPQWLLVWQSISCQTFSEFLYLNFYTLIIIIIISCHWFSFFPGTSLLEPVVNPTTQASSLTL